MDRKHIKYQQTNIDDPNDDCNDDEDESNELTAMMNGQGDVDDLGYDEDATVQTDPVPAPVTPPAEEDTEDALPEEEVTTGVDGANDVEGETREEEVVSQVGLSDDADGEEAESPPSRIEMSDDRAQRESTQAVGSVHADGKDVQGSPPASPPPYGEPPSYDEAVRTQRPTQRYREPVSGDDLEWAQDDCVEPTRLQDRDGKDDGSGAAAIELEDVLVVPRDDIGPRSTGIADTSFSTPPTAGVQPSQPSDEVASSSRLPQVTFSEISRRTWTIYGISFMVALAALLMVILLPLSFSYIEYYQYGMRQGRISQVVEYATEIYDMGQYLIGPSKTFKHYPAWAHFVNYDKIGFFTTDRIILEAGVSFQYFIKQDELGLIEQKFDRSYQDTIKSVAEAAIKNKGATYTTEDYFSQRGKVEQGLHDALRLKLGGDCCPMRDECIRLSSCHLCSSNQSSCNKGFHVDVRFFQLKQLFIPRELAAKQLNVQVILEGNEEALHRQTYQVYVKKTQAIVEKIGNEAAEISKNGSIQARLILKKSTATANAKRESANSAGLTLLYSALDVDNDEHKASLHWLRTMEKHQRLITGISFKEYIALMQGLHDDD